MVDLLKTDFLSSYFGLRGYECLKPHSVSNNNDTVFTTAGIQPIIIDYLKNKIENHKKIYISQPVIRTQFADSVAEGSSIAFVNSTTAGFNIDEKEYDGLIKDWFELFAEIGLKRDDFDTRTDFYEDRWGTLQLSGKRKFYYYNGLELGDSTFFTNIRRDGGPAEFETMTDIGFGLERLRWTINKDKSYFDIFSDSKSIQPEVKALISVLVLLNVNNIKPSNKNTGYRFRLFSKKLVNILQGISLNSQLKKYLDECVEYWKDWQHQNECVDLDIFENEYVRNCNRYIMDVLVSRGYDNISGININVSRNEFNKRLISSGVKSEEIIEML